MGGFGVGREVTSFLFFGIGIGGGGGHDSFQISALDTIQYRPGLRGGIPIWGGGGGGPFIGGGIGNTAEEEEGEG